LIAGRSFFPVMALALGGFAEELSRALIAFISSHKGIASRLLEYLRSVRGVEVDLNMAKVSLK